MVSLKHDGTDGTANTDGTAIEWGDGRDGTAIRRLFVSAADSR